MLFETLITVAALGVVVNADRPKNVTICDYYTPLLLGVENSATSQLKLVQTLTHTFILGNYTTPNVGIAVAGVATPADYSGHEVNILNYFIGAYYSTKGYNNASTGIAKNFLDDGGAVAY
ncbi:uncharacterized protein A1O9_12188 [Exophiala aquamarina CBS 119918]|uniref:Uncharacterized protein n=1 Tax=Exophiala aquamarina CBS 119918 TaxID=1182545 RepID=A0A072P8H0_9EURO|nr:uncharacterized protein A1O9_12188 [Exophiala aquamarina CBS 119918]KEF51850.1 hypothetical protein A1O9_12188 [Exophiala aquamarina CBS 119918]